MKKQVRFELEGKTYQVTVERVGNQLALTHEGKRFTLSLLPSENEEKAPPRQQPYQAHPAAGMPQAPSPMSPASIPSTPTASINSSGALHAPMTGVIKEIKAGVGHSVEQGQVVLIMEAMKMDIDVPSPVSGVVAEVSVHPGDNVNTKQQLMIIH